MKRRIFSLLIAAILLLVGAAFSTQAAELPADVEWIEIGDEATFNEWFSGAGKSKLLTDGYEANMTRYLKLTDDVTVTSPGTYYFNSTTYQINVYWDLNGHTLTYAEPSETAAPRFFGSYCATNTVTFVNGTITNEAAITGSHGAMFNISKGNLVMEDVTINDLGDHAFAMYGKVLSINTDQSCTLTNVDINVNNTNTTEKGLGGAIRCQGNLTMTDCNLTSVAEGTVLSGGLIYQSGGSATMTRCNFSGGIAKNGGAFYAESATVNATDCTFTDGKTSNSGNNVYLTKSTSEFEGCEFTITHSTANKFGGNFYCQAGTTQLEKCTITGGKSGNGGAVYSVNGELTLTDTDITGGHATTEGGNVMHKNGSLTMMNSSITDGVCDSLGGNLSLSNTAKFYFRDSTLENGKADKGGNIHASLVEASTTAPVLNIESGIITGGYATTNGGNINLVGLSGKLVTLNLTGGTVGGTPAEGETYTGYAGTGGGNIFGNYATVNISGDAVVSYGHSDKFGGNIYPSTACTLNLSGGTVTAGYAKDKGGNIYMSSTNTLVNITGGVLSDGFGRRNGGNIYHGNGKLTITGGVVTGGFAGDAGGNIQSNMGYGNSASASGALKICDDGDASTPLPQITNGRADAGDGGNLYVVAAGNALETGANSFTLGNCIISGGNAKGHGDEVYISAVTDFVVLPEFAQTLSVYIEDAMLPATLVGGPLNPDRASCTGAFTGKLVLENYGNPYIFTKADDTQLYVSGAAIVDIDGAKTWYQTNEEAVAAYAAAGHLQAAPGELVLAGGEYVVDLAGQTVNITGTGSVTCFDSANDTYETYGSVTVNGPTLRNETVTCVNSKDYYALYQEGVYSFHRLSMDLVAVALRPSAAGVYYTGKWSCDDAVAALIENFGIVVSLTDIPNGDFAENENTLWTTIPGSQFVSGDRKVGAMITGILKDTAAGVSQERIAKNSEYAQMPILASAYVTIDGVNYTGVGASFSMYDILKAVSDSLEEYCTEAAPAQEFMTHWSGNGLIGEPWDALDFNVSEDVLRLNTLYAGLQPYYGELHDHADTGGTSDGKQPLSVWKEGLSKLDMDFATIVDHRQSLHMRLEDWDNAIFIGGSEAATTIKDRDGVRLHYNMTFADPEGLEAVVSSFPEYNWRVWTEEDREGCGGQWHFDYPNFTAARFTEVCEAIYANGGFLSIVHPKSEGYVSTDVAEDAWFMDNTGVEVFYTYHSGRGSEEIKANYGLWTGMLKAGKKVFATAGTDEHNMVSDKSTSVIYAAERDAHAWVNQLRVGNFTAGGVGIRTAIGDTVMGGTTSFEGQRLCVSVGDFHGSLIEPGHGYRMDVVTDQGVVYSQEISCYETSYHVLDADVNAAYYYIEIYDTTDNYLLAIGNPIWNADK